MENSDDKKVINLFNHNHSNLENNYEEKFFKGFYYVKLEKDVNGNPFNEDALLDYAKKCQYIVRVMRKVNSKVALYNYKVPHNRITEFISKFVNNELNGEIVEVEKYIPEDLA